MRRYERAVSRAWPFEPSVAGEGGVRRRKSPLAIGQNKAESQPFGIGYSLPKSQRLKAKSYILGLIPGRAR